MNLMFVYGSLKKGMARHVVLADKSNYIGTASTENGYRLYRVNASYPGIVTEKPTGTPLPVYKVWGELYEVDDTLLHTIDKIEGISSGLFNREEINLDNVSVVNLPTSMRTFSFLKRNKSLTYLYNREVSQATVIEEGFWCGR